MTRNPVEHPVLSSIANRWSPYRFEPKPVEDAKLSVCFEAARWAASSFNEQPWAWMVAKREDTVEFERMLGCLMDANQQWAQNAGAIVLTAVRGQFSRNGKPNRVAFHDLGQAAAHFSAQAVELGLQVHQMAGINLTQVWLQYAIPEEYSPQTALAVGYPSTTSPNGDSEQALADRENAARVRKSLSEQVFCGTWGQNPGFID